MPKSKYIYTCGVDYQHELGHAHPWNKVYPSIEALKKDRECWKECGIVRLKVSLDKWIYSQNMFASGNLCE